MLDRLKALVAARRAGGQPHPHAPPPQPPALDPDEASDEAERQRARREMADLLAMGGGSWFPENGTTRRIICLRRDDGAP